MGKSSRTQMYCFPLAELSSFNGFVIIIIIISINIIIIVVVSSSSAIFSGLCMSATCLTTAASRSKTRKFNVMMFVSLFINKSMCYRLLDSKMHACLLILLPEVFEHNAGQAVCSITNKHSEGLKTTTSIKK